YAQVQVDFFAIHIGEHRGAGDAGVVDDDVDAAPLFDGRVHHGGGILVFGNVVAVGNGSALAQGVDLFHGFVSHFRAGLAVVAEGAAAQVVDDDVAAFFGQIFCIGETQAAPGAGDDRHFPTEIKRHVLLPVSFLLI